MSVWDTLQISLCDCLDIKNKQISRYSYPLYLYNIENTSSKKNILIYYFFY